jgi:hypothetical protein
MADINRKIQKEYLRLRKLKDPIKQIPFSQKSKDVFVNGHEEMHTLALAADNIDKHWLSLPAGDGSRDKLVLMVKDIRAFLKNYYKQKK